MPTDYAVRLLSSRRLARVSRASSWSLVTGERHAYTSVKRACSLTYLILLHLCIMGSVQTHRKLQHPPHSIESRRQHSRRDADLSHLLMLDATHTQFNTPDIEQAGGPSDAAHVPYLCGWIPTGLPLACLFRVAPLLYTLRPLGLSARQISSLPPDTLGVQNYIYRSIYPLIRIPLTSRPHDPFNLTSDGRHPRLLHSTQAY
jgi:hypothetical protein